MCVPDKTIVGATRGTLTPYERSASGKSQVQTYTPPSPYSIEQLKSQLGFQDVAPMSLGIPVNQAQAPVVQRSGAQSPFTVGADGIKRVAPQGYASLRIDRKGA